MLHRIYTILDFRSKQHHVEVFLTSQSLDITRPDPLMSPGSIHYPEPLVVLPLREHQQTWIILHGRGSNAEKFGPEFLCTPLMGNETLRTIFPNAKFVFPTASSRRATIYKRSLIHQWFDNWHLDRPTEREELQSEGLRDSTQFIHELLRSEIAIIGAENVVLGGLSQGCAAALVSMLLWQGEPLAAFFGMCGWLPYRKTMQEFASSGTQTNGGDDLDGSLFEETASATERSSPIEQAIAFLREEIECPSMGERFSLRSTPVFLGHGIQDDKVSVTLAREARDCLVALSIGDGQAPSVILKEYDGLRHWYSGLMLKDFKEFVLESLNRTESHRW